MHSKVHHKPALIAHSTRENQPLNRLVRHVPKFTLKKLALTSSLRTFTREYRLPLVMTLIFVLALSGVALIRMSERASLAGLLTAVSGGGQDYATLLSEDKPDEFKKNEAGGSTADENNSDSPQPSGAPSSFTTNPSNPTPSPGDGDNDKPPALVFGAAIAYFQQNNVTLECVNLSKPNKGSCSKKYNFGAGVRTSNGPGTVRYSWRSNVASANADSSFSASGGTVVTDLGRDIVLSCKNSGNYNMQFIVTAPSSVQSEVINFSHDCNDI